jgi:RHS repeat-associated protein
MAVLPDGETWKFYYFAGEQRIALRTATSNTSTLVYFLGDHLGSTTRTVKPDGTNLGEDPDITLYKAWGETRYASGTISTDYQYTGQRNEAGIGLYFYNARWYDNTLGRFTQADSILPGGIQGLDRYVYGLNNPILNNDPSGHCINGVDTVICLFVAIMAIGAIADAGHEAITQYQEAGHIYNWGEIGNHALEGAVFAGGAALAAAGAAAAVSAFLPSTGAVADRVCADGDCTNEVTTIGDTFIRYMSSDELINIKDTGMLRGGNPGETYMTTDYFETVGGATSRLSLRTAPDVGVQFEILNKPEIFGPNFVDPLDVPMRLGGGTEFWTFDQVRVNILNIWDLLK